MNKNIETEYKPDVVSHPGQTLADILEEREMSQVELAGRTGLTTKTINLIIKDGHVITPDTSIALEKALNIPAHFWNKREHIYRDFLAREKERAALAKDVEWLKSFPLNEMVKREWIQKYSDPVEQIRELLKYYGVASITQWHTVYAKPQALYRKSKINEADEGALSAWIRQGEIEAMSIKTRPYDASIFRKNLKIIRTLTCEHPKKFAPKMQELCADAGVALVFIPEISRTQTNGVTRWLSPNKALIQLCLLRKYADIFWFTFFHEAAHILKHGKKDVFLESSSKGKQEGDYEDEADRFAADFLIPPNHFADIQTKHRYTPNSVKRIARELNLLPGIVVGRLQHERIIPWSYLNTLRKQYKWS